MKCPKCGKASIFDHDTCPRCGHEMTGHVAPVSGKAPVQHEKGNEQFAGNESPLGLAQYKRYSKGGLIATGLMTALCAGALLQSGLNVANFLGYTGANIALLVRSFRPPLRWWQAILVWVGGFVAGTSFYVFLQPPPFEQRALGLSDVEVLPAKLKVFAIYFVVGCVLILLGALRRRVR